MAVPASVLLQVAAWGRDDGAAGGGGAMSWLGRGVEVETSAGDVGDEADSWAWGGGGGGAACAGEAGGGDDVIRFVNALDWSVGLELAAVSAGSQRRGSPAAIARSGSMGPTQARDAAVAAVAASGRQGGTGGRGGAGGAGLIDAVGSGVRSLFRLGRVDSDGPEARAEAGGARPGGASADGGPGRPTQQGEAAAAGTTAAPAGAAPGAGPSIDDVWAAAHGHGAVSPAALGHGETERRVALAAGRRSWAMVSRRRSLVFHAALRAALDRSAATADADGASSSSSSSSSLTAPLRRLAARMPSSQPLAAIIAAVRLASVPPGPSDAASLGSASRGSKAEAATAVCAALSRALRVASMVAERHPQAAVVSSVSAAADASLAEAVELACPRRRGGAAGDAPVPLLGARRPHAAEVLAVLEFASRVAVAAAGAEADAVRRAGSRVVGPLAALSAAAADEVSATLWPLPGASDPPDTSAVAAGGEPAPVGLARSAFERGVLRASVARSKALCATSARA